MKAETIISIIVMLMTIAVTIIYYFQLQVMKEQLQVMKKQLDRTQDEVFKPKLEILSPFSNQEVPYLLQTVSGKILGNIPDDYVVIVGHRELAENNVAIHIDRLATILSDNTFRADNIYLGSSKLGINATFELLALLVSKKVSDGLSIRNGDNPFQNIPTNIAKTTILVKRIK